MLVAFECSFDLFYRIVPSHYDGIVCGLTVAINKKNQLVPREILSRANTALAHRGPDHDGSFYFENCGLSFVQLSIVDIASGQQPLFNEDKSIALICNGEIYNHVALRQELISKGHRFSTGSDCEVLIHLYEEYGYSFLEQLDGMFAFALLDTKSRKLFYGKDRLGIKPLYRCENADWLILSSEIKGLLATGLCDREIDPSAISDFFTFNYIPGEATVFKNIETVSPATICIRDLQTISESSFTYWSPSFPKSEMNSVLQIPNMANALHDTFRGSVESHLIGDIDTQGCFLSGGIDSTVIALLMQANSKSKLTTFSISFAEEVFDESLAFREFSRMAGLHSEEHRVEEITASDFCRSILTIEQPQLSLMDVPMQKLAMLTKRAGIKYILSGEGADELFGGYPVFNLNQARRALSLPGITFGKSFLLKKVFERYGLDEELMQSFLKSYGSDYDTIVNHFGSFPVWYPVWDYNSTKKKLIFKDAKHESLAADSKMASISKILSSSLDDISEFDRGILFELKTRLCNYILPRTDKICMSAGVEARLPFLSNPMISLMSSLPSYVKMFGLTEKYILRKAFSDRLPKDIIWRNKFGYTAPMGSLFKNLDALGETLLSKASIDDLGIFDPNAVQQLLKSVQNEKASTVSTASFDNKRALLCGVISTQALHFHYVRGESLV